MAIPPGAVVDNTRAWASLVLRLTVSSLFAAAAIGKLKGGWASIQGIVGHFQEMFAETWLPGPLVTMHGYITPFVEALIPIWLLTGFRLKVGWIVTCLFMTTLAFGTTVAGKNDVAASNYNYVLICAVGLYLSRYDRYSIDGWRADRLRRVSGFRPGKSK